MTEQASVEARELAQQFHETYERLAPSFGYETRKESAKPWADVPDQNKRLMIAVCGEILASLPSPAAADVEVVPTFEQEWAKKEAEGYIYGHDALEQVRFGWEIAIAAMPDRKGVVEEAARVAEGFGKGIIPRTIAAAIRALADGEKSGG